MARHRVIDTATPQFTVAYDGTNYAPFSCSATGDLTVAPTGGTTAITGTLAVNGGSAAWRGSDMASVQGGNNAVILSATVPTGASMVTVRASGMTTDGIGNNDAYFEAHGAVVSGILSWRIVHDLNSTTGGGNQGFALLNPSGLAFQIVNKNAMSFVQQGVARADYF